MRERRTHESKHAPRFERHGYTRRHLRSSVPPTYLSAACECVSSRPGEQPGRSLTLEGGNRDGCRPPIVSRLRLLNWTGLVMELGVPASGSRQSDDPFTGSVWFLTDVDLPHCLVFGESVPVDDMQFRSRHGASRRR
jgi:hypothetical protein